MDYITKINDFKQVLNEIVNPENNKDKNEVIDALFDNVKKNYEEYKDVVWGIPAYCEPYEYHILQPVAGSYSLLDFLINRAVSNLEKISLEHGSGNGYDNHFNLIIDLDRYNRIASTRSSDVINAQYKKSKYHETLHALHSKFINEKGCFCSNSDSYFRKKVQYFHDKLWRKYSNILHPNQIEIAVCNRPGKFPSKPFEIKGWSSASLAMDEFSTEIEAVLNSELTKSGRDIVCLEKDYCQFLPNFDNGYAPFQVFMLQFKSLVSKLQYFESVFFNGPYSIEEFASSYSKEILSNAGKWNYNGDALNTFCNLFAKAISAVQGGNVNKFELYETLSKIFVQIYKNKLVNIETLDNETLELYKKTFAISYNEAPYKIVDKKCQKTWIAETYWQFYNIVSKELEKRNVNEKGAKL